MIYNRAHSVVDNANPHLGKRYVLKMDIHDFFFSLYGSPRVKKTFERDRLSGKCTLKYWNVVLFAQTLAQGAPTSPLVK